MRFPRKGISDINVVFCGEAGQGIQTMEELLSKIMKRSNFHVYSIKEYMSRIRGGSNSTSIRIGSKEVRSPVRRMDIVVPMSEKAMDHIAWRLDDSSVVVYDPDLSEKGKKGSYLEVHLEEISKEIGGRIYFNIITVGLISSLMGAKKEVCKRVLEEKFPPDSLEKNLKALDAGFGLSDDVDIEIEISPDTDTEKNTLMKGVEAVSFGAIAGGCDFISSYPMSPSTGVLVQLSAAQKRYGIVAEQAEDEISAVNMSLGAWYAGGRGMVTTSGGGAALMSEGISLSGMTELPMVIHLAQRPGPATGLPTRTEQGDLLMALFSGHGEFPRVLLAPGDPEQAFELTAKAFDTADRFQVPVIVLTDQFLLDSRFEISGKNMRAEVPKRHIIETDHDYARYRYTDDGISPRGVPGHGDGLVNVDSDEHDRYGHITESMETRSRMMNKRMKKMEGLRKDAIDPDVYGDVDGDVIVCWGSTLNVVREAVDLIEGDIGVVHISQVHPLSGKLKSILLKARRKVCVENNKTSQLAKLVKMEFGIEMDSHILKYNGLPFTKDELAVSVTETLNGGVGQ